MLYRAISEEKFLVSEEQLLMEHSTDLRKPDPLKLEVCQKNS
jgi:hypothetical protein